MEGYGVNIVLIGIPHGPPVFEGLSTFAAAIGFRGLQLLRVMR